MPTPSRGSAEHRREVGRRAVAAQVEAGPELGGGAGRESFEIGLVHEEDVGQLEQARLHELDQVARCGLCDEYEGLDEIRDAGLGLPDADRLDDHVVEARGQHVEARPCDFREAAQLIAGCERSEEDACVAGGGAHPEAVSEQCPAGLPARRIDGEDADRAAAGAQRAGEGVEQRRFAGARCPGQADPPASAMALERVEQDESVGSAARPAVVDQVECPSDGAAIALAHVLRECLRRFLVIAHAAVFASATTSTISFMMRARSKSFGV